MSEEEAIARYVEVCRLLDERLAAGLNDSTETDRLKDELEELDLYSRPSEKWMKRAWPHSRRLLAKHGEIVWGRYEP